MILLLALSLIGWRTGAYAQTAPLAGLDIASVTEDGSIAVLVLANDTDTDNDLDTASLQILVSPTHGLILSVDTITGAIQYQPFSQYYGTDSFSYSICDTSSLCDTAWVYLTVDPVNDRPISADDFIATLEGTNVLIPVLANDTDSLDNPFGGLNPTSLLFVNFPTRGSASLSGSGTISYMPGPGYFGMDSLAYSVADSAFPAPGGLRDSAWVYIEILQASPTAARDTASLDEDTELFASVLSNDSDPQNDLDSATLSVLTGPLFGTAVAESTSPFRIHYTPDANYFGPDSVQYRICDSTALCATAWLRLNVLPVNDPPLLLDDALSTNQTEPGRVDVLANDLDPLDPGGYLDTFSLAVVTPPASGSAIFELAELVYTPLPAFVGVDSLAYRACDAGTPGPTQCDTAWVLLTVFSGSPIAVLDLALGTEDNSVEIFPLLNDSDPQNNLNPASLAVLSGPFHGSALVDPLLAKITYQPTPNYFGADSLIYQICDSTALCSSATLRLNVTPVNDAPLAVSDTAIVGAGLVINIPVLSNDSDPLDPDGGIIAASLGIVSSPSLGTAMPDLFAGAIIYEAGLSSAGSDSMAYLICDNATPPPALCDTGWVYVTVFLAAPDAIPDSADVNEDDSVTLSPLINDTDPQNDIDPTTFTVLTGPLHGVVVAGSGTAELIYTPVADFYGTDSLLYRICDLTGLCDSTWIFLNVLPVNDAPVALDDAVTTPEDAAIPITVLSNDTDAADPDGGINTASVAITSGPFNGIALAGGTGIVTYTPAADFDGTDSFRYQVCDLGFPLPALCAEAWAVITVTPVNDPPIALPDVASTNEENPVSTAVLINDSDIEDGTLLPANVSLFSAPAQGSALVNTTTGQITYTPNADYYGADRYVYQVCDLAGACDTAQVLLTVNPINDAPNIAGDVAVTSEDVPVLIPVLSNDDDAKDPDGGLNSSSMIILTAALHGSTLIGPGGVITYTPDSDYNGLDSFRYRVCDIGFPTPPLCSQARVNIAVNPVNDLPLALPDAAVTNEDNPVSTLVLINDSDTEDGSLSPANLTLFTAPAQGSALVNTSTGQITYTPNPDFYGTDRYVYQVCDADGGCDTAQVLLTVNPINDAPNVTDDVAVTPEDIAVVIPILANDNDELDPDGGLDVSSVTIVSGPFHGATSIGVGGAVTYTPSADYNGPDSFRYQVCDIGFPVPPICGQAWVLITVNGVNDPPVIVADVSSGLEDNNQLISLLANDTDTEDGAPLPSTVVLLTLPANGAAVLNPSTGEVTYTPDSNYNGPDGFTYRACDGNGACGTATVTITVTPVNDPPVALDDFRAWFEDSPLVVNILANDSDPLDPGGGLNPSSVTAVSGPFNGTVNFSTLTGQATYIPNLNFNGVDSVRYQVCDIGVPLPPLCADASIFILLSPINDMPSALDDADATPENTPVNTAVLDNDSDPADPLGGIDPGSVTIVSAPTNGSAVPNPTTGVITYTPNPGFIGMDSYVYQVCDLGTPLPALCDQATVVITVSNEAPTANNDIASTLEDNAVIIEVLLNDTDPQPNIDITSVLITSAPSLGTAIPSPVTGQVLYTPNLNANGTDVFGYRVCDLDGFCDQAIVTVTITPVNDPPLLVADAATTPEDTPVTTVVIANDSDPADPLSGINPATLSILTPPTNGGLSLDLGLGSVTYSPDPDFNGVDFYIYQVCDLGNPLPALCGTASVLVNVTAVNDTPLVVDDAASTLEDIAVSVNVLLNDSDEEDGTLLGSTVLVTIAPANGTTIVNPTTGFITYTPNLHFNGVDVFTYQACDGDGACDIATVTVTVGPVNDPPQAADDAATTLEDASVVVNVLDNDNDALDPASSLDPTSVTVLSLPANGSTSVSPLTGAITYTPDPDFYGTDVFTYQVCDNGLPLPAACASATVTVTVSPVNDAPMTLEDLFVTAESTPGVFNVLANDNDDADPDGGLDPTSVFILTAPENGAAVVDGLTGLVTYTPDPGYSGADSFVYQVCDLGFPLPPLCTQATALISVSSESPVAVDDLATVPEDGSIDMDVLDNDTDPQNNIDPTTVTIVLAPLDGSALVNPVTGVITYTPDPDYQGSDFLEYRVCDLTGFCDIAQVDITVTPVNDPPLVLNDNDETVEDTPVSTSVLLNDSDPHDAPFSAMDPGTISIVAGPSNGSIVTDPFSGLITYTPDPDFFGSDSYTYRVCDNGFPLPELCDNALVVITVTPVDDPIVAIDDVDATAIGVPVEVEVLDNDIDPDGDIDPLSVAVIIPPANGVANPLADGSVRYTPDAGFSSVDTFSYRVCDLNGNCDSAIVVVGVTAIPPIAVADESSTLPGQSVEVDVLANDEPGNSDLDSTSVTITMDPLFGTAAVDEVTGVITYTPESGFCGLDSLTYRVCDVQGLCATATVLLSVECITLEALDDEATTPFDTPVLIPVLINDSPNADPDCLVISALPEFGTVELQPDGQLLYTPVNGYS